MNLDNLEEINNLDKSNVAESIVKLPDQIKQAWRESAHIKLPESYKRTKSICIVGMGGSGLGPEVVYHLYKDDLKIPLVLVHDYDLPGFVNEDTLVLLSSYSGTTEEVLGAAKQAISRKCKVAAITEGNQLGQFLDENGFPYYKINTIHNPSKQPRYGIGYLVIGILGTLRGLDLIQIEETEGEKMIRDLRELNSKFLPSVPSRANFPKEIAQKLKNNMIGIIGSQFLSGIAHIFANQLNETSKTFAFYFLLPELNHHLLEGFGHPLDIRKHLKIILLESDYYSEKIKKRAKITADVIEKQKVETFTIKFEQGTPLRQAFEALLITSWISFYLGVLNEVDLSITPWVDYFKKQLAKT